MLMDVHHFFQHFIEGYLFGDLERMAEIGSPDEQYGGVTYPMLATTLSGMELLGELLMTDREPFTDRGNISFDNYWKGYFLPANPEYEYENLGDLFRHLMRHGIAHSFLTKPGIFVGKNLRTKLSLDQPNRTLHIDAKAFYKDFRKSYDRLVRPRIDWPPELAAPNKDTIQFRLNALLKQYTADTNKRFGKIKLNLVFKLPDVNDDQLAGPSLPETYSGVQTAWQ